MRLTHCTRARLYFSDICPFFFVLPLLSYTSTQAMGVSTRNSWKLQVQSQSTDPSPSHDGPDSGSPNSGSLSTLSELEDDNANSMAQSGLQDEARSPRSPSPWTIFRREVCLRRPRPLLNALRLASGRSTSLALHILPARACTFYAAFRTDRHPFRSATLPEPLPIPIRSL